MHPIVIYELVKTRMDQDREAERHRLAQAEMPRVPQAPASRRPPRKNWRGASFNPWIRASCGDRSEPSRIGDIGFPPGVTEMPARPGRLRSLR